MLILLVLLLVLVLVGAPQMGWHTWGYAPSGVLMVVVIVLVCLLVLGRL